MLFNVFFLAITVPDHIKVYLPCRPCEDFLDINKKTPKKGDIVVIRGKKKDGCVFADVIAVQTNKIYTKLSEIKKDE